MSNRISHVSALPAGPQAPNWLVEFCDNARAPVTPDEVGELCVVWLKDGSRIVGTPKLSARSGKFDFTGYAGHTDALDQSEAKVSKVNWIKPHKTDRASMSLAA